jgi:hypothetical protein
LRLIQTLQKITPTLVCGVSKSLSVGQNLNIIQEQFFYEPDYTKLYVKSLQHLPWVRHKHGCNWPDCACLACCGELIITVIEKATDAFHTE